MAKKYDTNPLDGELFQRVEDARRTQPQPTATQENFAAHNQFFEAQTRQFHSAPTAEQPTQPFNNSGELDQPYHSVFGQPQEFAATASVSSDAQKLVLPPTSRKVLGLGLPEKIAMLLAYLPFTMGAIAGVLILLFASRTETRVRFHAAQGLALHLVSWIVGMILGVVMEFAPFGNFPNRLFWAAVTIFFIISLVRVWQGKANHLEALDDVTDFLNEKLKPRK